MAVAQPLSEQTGRDRRAIAGEFSPAARRREGPGRRPPPTLGEVIEAVAYETENDTEVLAVVAYLFHTRTVRWPASCAHSDPDRRATAFD